jgi:thiamine monophosphate synthase
MIPQAKQPVYALGGVKPENIEEVASLGFSGAVLLGALWKGDEKPHLVYKAALEAAHATQSK